MARGRLRRSAGSRGLRRDRRQAAGAIRAAEISAARDAELNRLGAVVDDPQIYEQRSAQRVTLEPRLIGLRPTQKRKQNNP
jgi:hypothetical protein